MKALNNEEIIFLIEHCNPDNEGIKCERNCPLFAECLYYYTGDDSLNPVTKVE